LARGMHYDWSRRLYDGARTPDLVFYFKVPVETCATRIAGSRELKFYEAGQDVTGLADAYESYVQFTRRVVSEYERLREQFGFVVIDGTQSIYEQHRAIREAYLRHC